MSADVTMLVSPDANIIFRRMNDNCITKVVVFRRIAMGSLVRRYIVTKGQVKPLLDACIIFPRQYDSGII